jgi:hypothetical protein
MADHDATSSEDPQDDDLQQAIVTGSWEQALDLATQSDIVSIHVKTCALKTWLGQGHWHF